MSEVTRIVVLGGGYGGVHAAKQLHKKFKKRESIEITLIDKNPYHTLMTELHEIAGSRTEPEAVQVSFKKIFGGKRVNVAIDEIDTIDFEGNTLRSRTREYKYDHLIIGAGGQPEFFGCPGVQENSLTCWSIEDAIRIRTHVEDRFRAAAKEPDKARRESMLTFAIAGAGFTGVELAGEFMERREVLCPKYHIDKREVRIIVIEAQDKILPVFPEKPRRRAAEYLRRKGVEVLLNSPVSHAEEGKVVLGDGAEIVTDTFIWTCGIHGSEFTARIPLTHGSSSRDECSVATPDGIHGMSGCAFDEDERYVVGKRGRILVDSHMRSVDFPNVYLVGDIIWYVHEEKVVPQVVETAIQTAEVAAKNVIADIDNKEKHDFKPNYHGHMVSVGGKYGVAHVMGMSLSGFFAMAVKHLINVHYLVGLAGLNAVWEYVQEEFFQIKNGRSILGSHASAKIPTYWAVPLRLFLGGKWLYEGIKKVQTGWLNPGSGGWFNVDPEAVYLPGVSFVEGVAAATSATPNGGGDAGAWGTSLMEALPIYTWFAENVLSASATMSFWLQAAVVVTQVLVGLALIGGLFTFLAAAASIGMGVMFIVSGWGNTELLWYIAAAFVMLGGAGRGFGLDHWVMPWLKNWWNGTWFAKSTYLYAGEPRTRFWVK